MLQIKETSTGVSFRRVYIREVVRWNALNMRTE